jgi:hypothetical protein
MREKMNYEEWLQFGVENGFCSAPVCCVHDGMPMHETEERAWEEGGDPCQVVVRLGTPSDWKLPSWWFNEDDK